jgi:LuxR family maltose regulon positive regulatory protein
MTAIGAASPGAIRSHPRDRARTAPAEPIVTQPGLTTPAGVVARSELVERLIAARGAALALLVAPAGYGKTTLLAEWAACDARPFGWLRLRPEDCEPQALARAIADAIGRSVPQMRDELDCAVAGKRRRSIDAVARSLCGALSAAREPFVLVVDNGHLLRNPETFQLLERVVESVGPDSQVAVAARREPALATARFRTERRLFELRAADLVLTRPEVAAVAAAAGLALDRRGCDLLAERTEGWPAGVYLAALALRDQPAPEQAVAAFGGDDRLVTEYVRDELLAEMPCGLIEFLARSSMLTRLSGPLCDYVLDRRDSARLLRELSRMNLLLVPLDRTDTEYRYHTLLAESLRSELRLREPGLEAELHLRASEWHEQQGERELAIEHALHGEDVERAAALLWDATPDLLGHGNTGVLSRWLEYFSPLQITDCAPLALSAASAHLMLGDCALAEHWTATAQDALDPDAIAGDPSLEAGLQVLRAIVAATDLDEVRLGAAHAYELACERNEWRSLACLVEGMALRLGADPVAARIRLEEGARRGVALAPAVQILCLGQLALIAIDDADWDRAAVRASIARAQIDRVGLEDFPMAALVFAASAAANAHLCRPEAAERDARQADRLLARLTGFVPWYTAQCRIALAWAAVRLGEIARARQLVEDAARDLSDHPQALAALASLRACQAQIDTASAARTEDAEQLTTAELRVLQFLPTHLSFPEIADELYVSRNTVKTHVRAVYRKLAASSRSEAVQHARDAGLLDGAVA